MTPSLPSVVGIHCADGSEFFLAPPLPYQRTGRPFWLPHNNMENCVGTLVSYCTDRVQYVSPSD